MARNHVDLPTVTFRVIQVDEDVTRELYNGKHANFNKNLLESYGFNPKDEKPWKRPQQYIRWIGWWDEAAVCYDFLNLICYLYVMTEPTEAELANQVEYDMDEQGE
jgi:hypothetical protein